MDLFNITEYDPLFINDIKNALKYDFDFMVYITQFMVDITSYRDTHELKGNGIGLNRFDRECFPTFLSKLDDTQWVSSLRNLTGNVWDTCSAYDYTYKRLSSFYIKQIYRYILTNESLLNMLDESLYKIRVS